MAGLASRRTYALTSSFHPTYNMAANLVQRYPPQQARHLLNLSFAQFHADRDVVAVERELGVKRTQLAKAEAAAAHPGGDVHEYRRLLAALEAARRSARGRVDRGFASLRPGDVVLVPKRGGKGVVLKQERGSGPNQRILVLTQGKALVRISPQDLRGPVRKLTTIELPRPFAPRSQSFQKSVSETLRRLKVRESEVPPDPDADVEELRDAIAEHPLHDAAGADVALRAAWQSDRIARDIARLERRISSRNDSLARQFDRVLGVLRTWGYVEDWSLTDAGRLLTRLNSEGELVVAEAVREGNLDRIDPATLAAVVSCFTFQRRGPDSNEPMPPRRWPNQEVARRSRALDAVWRDLHLAEREGHLPETRRPDPGFTAAIYAWVKGDDLADVLEDEEMTGGDFVRNVKQTIDLLRQIADVVSDGETAHTARAAADACLRGVIAASSIVKAPAA